MSNPASPAPPRLLTDKELGAIVLMFREMRHWSQEQLAEIARINVRTVQRVEKGVSASFDTRRALAQAFELEDIDMFNKPVSLPSEDEQKAAKEAFDRENVTLAMLPVASGRQLASLVETSDMDYSYPAIELPRESAEAFAEMVDGFREYRDCSELYSEVDKLEIYDQLQGYIDTLASQGLSLRYAQRQTTLRLNAPEAKPVPMAALYLIVFRQGEEPERMAVPRSGKLSF